MTIESKERVQNFLHSLGESKDFIEDLLRDNERLRMRVQEVQEENRNFVDRYLQIEQQNNNLANLYVVSHQLHSTLDFREVVKIVQEVVINFIGSECFAILLMDEESRMLRTIAAEGAALIPGIDNLTVRFGEGQLGSVAVTAESYFAKEDNFDAFPDPNHPLAVVPLKIKDHPIGLLVIYQLLQQKGGGFSETDYNLFSLLAGQAATAIFSAKLYSDAERKLNTIQGFLDLLTIA